MGRDKATHYRQTLKSQFKNSSNYANALTNLSESGASSERSLVTELVGTPHMIMMMSAHVASRLDGGCTWSLGMRWSA